MLALLSLVVLTQLACAEGRGPAANLVRSARPRQLQAVVPSADGWMQGRASYFGPPASFNDTFVQRSVKVCGSNIDSKLYCLQPHMMHPPVC